MIKARAGSLILLGLSEGNLGRLREGKPILVKGTDLGIEGGLEIAIMYGATEDDIILELQRSGIDLGGFVT